MILSGGAEGADAVAEALAIELEVPMTVFAVGSPRESTQFRASMADEPWSVESVTSYGGPEDDPRSGRGAYLPRNCMMAEAPLASSVRAVAWQSGTANHRGTRNMLDSCGDHGIDTSVWQYSE